MYSKGGVVLNSDNQISRLITNSIIVIALFLLLVRHSENPTIKYKVSSAIIIFILTQISLFKLKKTNFYNNKSKTLLNTSLLIIFMNILLIGVCKYKAIEIYTLDFIYSIEYNLNILTKISMLENNIIGAFLNSIIIIKIMTSFSLIIMLFTAMISGFNKNN